MSRAKVRGALPGGVKIDAEPWGNHISVTYLGSEKALLAAGCLTRQMRQIRKKYRIGDARGLRDEHGQRFSLHHLATKSEPDRMKLSRYVDSQFAMQLPGVRDLYPEGIQETTRDATVAATSNVTQAAPAKSIKEPRMLDGKRTERDAVERYYPGLHCRAVFHMPDHWSGFDDIAIHIEGSRADMLRHGLLTEDMLDRRPLRDHETWDNRSRRLTVNWLSAGFEVVISNYGDSVKTVMDVLHSVRGKRGPKEAKDRKSVEILTARDALTRWRSRPSRPDYLRLVVDNTKEQARG